MESKEMVLQYRKSMDHNYLVAELPTEAEGDYQLEMILENNISGLLKASRRMNEGKEQIYYEISSLQPLSRIYDHKEIKRREAALLLRGLVEVLKSIQEYMLGEGSLITDPEYLFVDPESLKPCMLFIPWNRAAMQERLLVLMEYLMEHIDQNDPSAAMWTYRLYKTAKNENCILTDIEKLIGEEAAASGTVTDTDDKVWASFEMSAPKEKTMHDESVSHREKPLYAFDDEDVDDGSEVKTGFFAKIFGGRGKADANKGFGLFGKKKDRDSGSFDDREDEIPDFTGVFDDMDTVKQDDGQDGDYGRTVFIGESDAPVKNMLVDKSKGREYRIKSFPYTIGKVRNCVDLPLNDSSVSRIHARIIMQNGRAYIQDCHSTNGTFVNGVQLEAEEQVMLEKEDEVGIGRLRFNYI